MTRIRATFYDGRTSTPKEATLDFSSPGSVGVEAGAGDRRYALETIRVRDRVGARSPREIEFPDGALAHVAPDAEADRVLDRIGGHGAGWIRRLESKWRHAAAALVTCALAIASLVHWGIPALAEVAAQRVPHSLERSIGERSLAGLDEDWLAPSILPAARRAGLRRAFRERIVADRPAHGDLRLEFRAGGIIGPNALALPGGIVVVTDELVGLAEHDDEILAVLAHETGHVVARHTMRQVFESLGVTVIVTTLTGDLSGFSSVAAAVPAVLVQAAYSRRDEREADAYAFGWSERQGVPRSRMTDLLERIEAQEGGGDWPAYFSTHPSTKERAEAARSPR